MTEDKLRELRRNIENGIPSDHYGVFNIAERLRIRYGKEAFISIESAWGSGTTAILSYPVSISE